MPTREGTLTANGNSEVVQASGSYTLHLGGTFGGGTAQLQFQDKSGTWRNYKASKYAFTDVDDVLMNEKQPTNVRIALTEATSPSLFYRFGI